jgi:hypothetical protein
VRCATVLYLTLLVAGAKAAQPSALPDDSRGQNAAGHQAVAPRPNPDAAGKYHVGMEFRRQGLFMLQTPSLAIRQLAKSWGARWSCH